MRLGHARNPDGQPWLFAEAGGRRLPVKEAATLDALLRTDERDAILKRLESALASGAGEQPDSDVSLSPPLLHPGKVLAIGLNYLDHCREFGVRPPSSPIMFTKLGSSICGHGDSIRMDPTVTREVDWEAELGVVIGRVATDATEADALDAVFGYTVINDVSARDIQRSEQQWTRAKGLDTFCPIGPAVVTADEVGDPQALAIRSAVNGQTMQDSSTAEMIFGVAELVALLSRSLTLFPGDVIATGTPVGVGGFREPPVFLRDGDIVEVEVERVGVLRNPCVAKGGTS